MANLALKDWEDCDKCPTYKRRQHTIKKFRAGILEFVTLACGHTLNRQVLRITPGDKLRNYQWEWNGVKKLFDPFQIHTIQKTEEANGVFLNLNQMGLGKMVTSIATLYVHPEMLPALVVCKARLRRQWFEHLVRMSADPVTRRPLLLPERLEGGREMPSTDIFNVTIVSYDGLWRIINHVAEINKALPEDKWVNPFAQFKTIILDEFQLIKNPEAKRTKGVRLLAKDIEHKLFLSGTPTKNSAEEYFVPLNMVRPDLFPVFKDFCREWVEYYIGATGRTKALGIRPGRKKQFDELIAPFSVRYTREEVMPELPKVFRNYTYVDLADDVKKAYMKEMKDFEKAYTDHETAASQKDKFAAWGVLYDSMMKLKRLAGLATADWFVSPEGWIEEFLDNTDEKVTIFHHHIEVGTLLAAAITNMCKERGIDPPVHIHGGLSEDTAFDMIEDFKFNPKKRILIARQLAEGEGLNLQQCGHMVQLERQWNPANEEQCEDRFPRPGTTYERINALYPTAVGTIVEFLAEIVERKRYAAENTYGKGSKVHWVETDVLRDLAKTLFEKGRKPWGQVVAA